MILKLLGGVLTVFFSIIFSLQPGCNLLHLSFCADLKPKAETFNLVGPIFAAVLYAFNRWFWRMKIGRWIGWKSPDIQGTWRGELELLRHLPGIRKPNAPIPIVLVVRQEAFRIRLTLYTAESNSSSLAADFTKIDDENELVYSYRNESDPRHRLQSPIHIGTAVFKMLSLKPASLIGEYYTDRLTAGRMSLTEHTSDLAVSFNDASQLTFKLRPVIR
ncbi:hypothetical protein FNU79_17780 [Deinococcus detaillensis]|uniref:CD-NTase-associated protein 15 domain-containing protein n=1 Tax=Deinococcus detaillensis TaxID=2592048 RepID=A0A553UHN6_9DEIO|nr:hypothetical protein [Deinococcus detaillensis]TSA79541.1 hypothetical protein FNU79_17780 [Deinococcus detaillensis]